MRWFPTTGSYDHKQPRVKENVRHLGSTDRSIDLPGLTAGVPGLRQTFLRLCRRLRGMSLRGKCNGAHLSIHFVDLVVLPEGPHPIPFQTRSLSLPGPMVLRLKARESRSPPGLQKGCIAPFDPSSRPSFAGVSHSRTRVRRGVEQPGSSSGS